MSESTARGIQLTRLGHGRYEATNSKGVKLELGMDSTAAFTPVELFLAAIAGCNAIDVDLITGKRAQPVKFDISMSATKVRDDDGNHLVGLTLHLDVEFPEGDAGDAARESLPTAVTRSQNWLCTVGRTVELGTPISVTYDG